MKTKPFFLFVFISLCQLVIFAQNETRNWAFGGSAGLNFITNPPTVTSYSPFGAGEGISCISDANGNYLFGSDAATINNSTNGLMANGAGVSNNGSGSQCVLIAKQPNSNLFYVFTVPNSGGSGLYYSIVDMNLAAGMGSVTVKNATLMANFQSAEMVAGIVHCNGVDTWIVTHPRTPGKFYSFLLTANGLNTTPVTSTTGLDTVAGRGHIKFSPDGKKIALPYLIPTPAVLGGIVIHDFDKSTGAVSSNSMLLSGVPMPYGIEFSPDGSKIYATHLTPNTPPFGIYQWNLCAGSVAAINASKYILDSEQYIQHGALQCGNNGKIYVTRGTKDTLGVINSPNMSGTSCSYTRAGQSISPRISGWSLPNFVSGMSKPTQAAFTSTSNCQNFNFVGDATPTICTSFYYPVTGIQWDFGDPASGQNNASTQNNPSHFFSATGTYTVKLILVRQCSIDTLIQTVNVTALSPSFSLTSPSGVCIGQSITIAASGSYSYQWSNGSNTPSITVNPTINTVYTATASNGLGCIRTQSVQITASKCNGIQESIVNSEITIYPNPTSGVLNVQVTSGATVKIYDTVGKLLYQTITTQNNEKIDISFLPDGLFFMELTHDNQKVNKRIVKSTGAN